MEGVIVLVLAGAVLLAFEPVLPHLISGFAGLGCWVAAFFWAYAAFGPEPAYWLLAGLSSAAFAGVWWYVTRFPRSRFGRRFLLPNAPPAPSFSQSALQDRRGVALTRMRPGGAALIDGRRVDVITAGEAVEAGAAVVVVAVEGPRVVVRPV